MKKLSSIKSIESGQRVDERVISNWSPFNDPATLRVMAGAHQRMGECT